MIGLSHLALAGALAACLAGIGGYVHGTGVGRAQEQASQQRAYAAAQAATRKLQVQLDAATEASASKELTRQENVRTITRESKTIIERPIYSTVCVDADGVRLLDRAAENANGKRPDIGPPAGDAGGTPEGGTQP